MAYFDAPRPPYRWQTGLLLLSLPRRLIRAASAVSRRVVRTSPSVSNGQAGPR